MAGNLKRLVRLIEAWVPPYWAEEWDNVGLLITPGHKELTKVLVALDPTPYTLEEAAELGADLLVTHHPLLLKPLSRLRAENPEEALIRDFIKAGIGLYVLHTNFDRKVLAREVAIKLGLRRGRFFGKGKSQRLFKLVVYVPSGYEQAVREALITGGAGQIGAYSHCTFATTGTGTFKPGYGTNPFCGKPGRLEKTKETRLETIVPDHFLATALVEMKKAHPYEEVAYDIYHLHNQVEGGFGVIGELAQPLTPHALADHIKECLDSPGLRLLNMNKGLITTVALVPGKGGTFLKEAVRLGAHAFVTGDIDYHCFREGQLWQINVFDPGHYYLERASRDIIAKRLAALFRETDLDIEVSVSTKEKEPFVYWE